MIIKTFSDESTLLGQKTRDLLGTTGKRVVLVPDGVQELFITLEEETNELVIYLTDGEGKFLDIARGYESLEECWTYAMIVTTAADLPEENIAADVYEKE